MTIRLQHVWTVDSGTTELPRVHRGAPLAEVPTTELAWWEPKPSVPTRYVRPDRTRHLRESFAAAFWPAVMCSGVIVALLIIAHLHGAAPISSSEIYQ